MPRAEPAAGPPDLLQILLDQAAEGDGEFIDALLATDAFGDLDKAEAKTLLEDPDRLAGWAEELPEGGKTAAAGVGGPGGKAGRWRGPGGAQRSGCRGTAGR